MSKPSHIKLVDRRFSASFDGPGQDRKPVKIFSGQWHVSAQGGEVIITILGSCVAACIYDPVARVGGMNHFLLPGDDVVISQAGEAARYGAYAMEQLINGLLKAGARKDRLMVKVFGGGNVIRNSQKIGSKNAVFIRDYLKREGLKIEGEDLEGDLPRRIHFFPDTGKVMMRKLHRRDDAQIMQEENRYRQTISTAPVEGDVDLF